jgi:hypothetical protein
MAALFALERALTFLVKLGFVFLRQRGQAEEHRITPEPAFVASTVYRAKDTGAS